MTTAAIRRPTRSLVTNPWLVRILVGVAFVGVFAPAFVMLMREWVTSGEYGHGFLLLPISLWMAHKTVVVDAVPDQRAGLVALSGSAMLFLLGVLASDPFLQRLGMLATLASLTVFYLGWAQLRVWWLPAALLASAVPLPGVMLDSLTMPLQLFASNAAVWLLQARHIPAAQAGNVIFLPGQELFVAAACSGLRSLSALIGLTLLIAGTMVSSISGRMLLLVLAVPAAILANAIRVFATGVGAYYIGPQVAEGFTHHALAAAAFTLPLGVVAAVAFVIRSIEK